MERQVLVSAGDAITAKLVEQAGFDGIWVSGFEASARLGLADNGSITMTEMLNVAKPIVEAVSIPVWVDVDTGYSNFARTVREFERIGVTGVCVQDDDPAHKTNSLWGGKTPLMGKVEFAKKINVPRKKLKVMARTEALIRGYGYQEALSRLYCYRSKGKADWVLPHIRSRSIRRWPFKRCAIVPTKFPEYTNTRLFSVGYSMVIWANQTERVKIKAIREALQVLKKEGSAENIEKNLSASLDDMRGLCPLQ